MFKCPDFTEIMDRADKESKEKEKQVDDKIVEEVKVVHKVQEKEKQTVDNEEESLGAITWSTYVKYWRAGGCHWFVLIMLFFTVV